MEDPFESVVVAVPVEVTTVTGDDVDDVELEGSAEVVVLVIVEPLASVVVSVMAVEPPDPELHLGQ